MPLLTSRILLALVSILGLNANAFAQFRFDTWTTDNGLPQNGVRQITQTPDGYLWFTTFDGLVRFDGVRFTTFGTGNTKGIINNRFTGLYGDKDGTLYATTMEDGVLTVYRDGVFTSYSSEQVPGHYIQRILPDANGELRFQVEDEDRTSKSWYYLRNGTFVFSEKDVRPPVLTIVARSGSVWSITTQGSDRAAQRQDDVYPLNISPITFNLNTFEDSTGHIWLGEYAVHRLGGGTVERFGEGEGLPRSIHHSFWEDPDGNVWFASGGGSTQGVGLVRYLDGRMQSWGTESGLLNTSIYTVFHDREHTTWVATNKGLSRLRRTVLNAYSVNDGLNHTEVYPIYRDRRERIWIGTIKGLSIYENGRFAPARPEAGRRRARRPAKPGGRHRVGAVAVGGRRRPDVGRPERRPLPGRERRRPHARSAKGHHVFAIRGDRHGNTWAATNKGILHYRDTRLRGHARGQGRPPERVHDARLRGLQRHASGSAASAACRGTRDGKFTNYTTKEGWSAATSDRSTKTPMAPCGSAPMTRD